jgi:lipopolysaccharide/colanic/teichoic acid biosynthesis glycosyltransferase
MTHVERKRSAEVFAREVPVWKRTIDVAGALVLIVATAPVMLLTAAYIKLVSPGKILFKQERIGHGGRPFTILKFRTMRSGADVSSHKSYMAELIRSGDAADKPMVKLDGENPEIIPLGNALRKSAVDELPQLFNVLRGDMSLVGPRPVIPYEAKEFLDWHYSRFDVLPGLTGLWQVEGKNSLTFNEMIRLDVRYSRDFSPALDARIILRTPGVILGQLASGVSGRRDANTVVQPAREN